MPLQLTENALTADAPGCGFKEINLILPWSGEQVSMTQSFIIVSKTQMSTVPTKRLEEKVL
ncbi:hypothetical protein OUZ56_011674 [Daphnia magna]|uniref:Uncharacterized protein n=1 Tax=Daphnia magna TaxID=35525 RepID=A0ABQ9Z251_9CRUS|nr:hypothetical protein OUZ56_011674 [Daphnia magna]